MATRISDLIDAWNTRESEFRAWVAGTPTGGPNGDGHYPLSDGLGNSYLEPCPALLTSTVTGPSADAQAAKTASETAEAGAQTAEAAAQSAEAAAQAAQTAAETARDLSQSYMNQSASSAANSGAYASDLEAAKTAAQAAQADADSARDAAQASQAASHTSETNAAASATAASGSATAASTSATNAAASATAASGSATAASASASAASTSASAAATSKTGADTSATNAGNSATAASGSASAASTSATNAGNSATAAAGSASAASTSASNAATSATNAAASATAAATFVPANYVAKAGDTMGGNLTVTATGADSWIISKAPTGWAGHVSVIGNNGTAGTTDFVMTQDSVGGAYVWNRSNQYMLFATNSAERMRITATGNVGIGTTTVPSKLTVGGTQGHYRIDPDAVASTLAIYATNSADTGYLNLRQDAALHAFAISGSEKMRLGSNGWLSIGDTTTDAPFKVLNATEGFGYLNSGAVSYAMLGQVSGAGAVAGWAYDRGSGNVYLIQGGVWNGTKPATWTISNTGGLTCAAAAAFGGANLGGWSNNGNLSANAGSGGWAVSAYNTGGSGGAFLARVDNTGTGLAAYYYGTTQVGGITTTGSATAFNTTSDERLKTFTGTYAASDACGIIRMDPVRTFTWNDLSADPGAPAVGWGAQTSHGVSPDLASPGTDELDEDGRPTHLWGIDQSKRTPYLWAAVGATGGILDRLDAMEAKLSALQADYDAYKATHP